MPYTYQRIRCAICNDCNRQQWRFVSSSFSFLLTLCVRRSHGERRLRGQLSSGQVEKNIMEHASKDSSTKGSSATRAIYTDGSEPLPLIPGLRRFYEKAAPLAWPIIRFAVSWHLIYRRYHKDRKSLVEGKRV